MQGIKAIITEYINSFKECPNCEHMCLPKHFTKNNLVCKVCIEEEYA